MTDLEAFLEGRLPLAKETDHFAYSEVSTTSYAASHLAVIRSVKPIAFGDMVQYFTQADAFEDFVEASGVERTEAPLTWFYWNDPEQPPDPGGNPVRAPFTFEVGYEIVAPPAPLRVVSESVGEYVTRPLDSLRVASILYRGSFPHQEHSAFGEAWMTMVTQAPVLGYRLTGRLYRERYHHLDYSDPSQSVTEIQVEIHD